MTDQEWDIVKENLQHFDPNEDRLLTGWNIRVKADEAAILKKHCKYLSVKKCSKAEQANISDGRIYHVRITKKLVDTAHLIRYYKEAYRECQRELSKLQDSILKLIS